MRNAKGTIVAEGPDIVGCGSKIVRIAITPADVLVRCMNGFGPSVQLMTRHFEPEYRPFGQVARSFVPGGKYPCLRLQAVGRSRRRSVRGNSDDWSYHRCAWKSRMSIVRIDRRNPDNRYHLSGYGYRLRCCHQITQTSCKCCRPPEFFKRICFTHQLTERFAALTVVFQNRLTLCCVIKPLANFTRNFGQSKSLGTCEPSMPGDNLPGSLVFAGNYDQVERESRFHECSAAGRLSPAAGSP